MNFQKTLMASFALNQFIDQLSALKNPTEPLRGSHSLPIKLKSNEIMGFENTSPDNTWVLRSTGDSLDYIVFNYALVLPPGEEQWLESYNLSKHFVYQVCDTSGEAAVLYVNGPLPMCAVYSGAMMNISITPDGITAKAIENTAINAISVTGDHSPYAISATTLPPPECELPYPRQYNDEKWRIINLEGATLFEPQFPNICDVSYFAEVGANTIRLPFKWDYLQCFLSSDIPINWATGGYGAQMVKVANAWTEKNYTVILSMYDHMRYSYCAIGASDCWVSQARYANAWGQIAAQFSNNPRVVFGLMNQPDVDDYIKGDNNGTTIVLNNQNAAARAIRSTGASQWILYSGNGGSNIENWSNTEYGDSNRKTFIPENITDHHYKIEVQMFYPKPNTLPEDGCIATAIDNPQSCVDKQNPENFIQWMSETGIQVIIGQTGGANSSECIICINQGTTWMMLQNNITGIGMWTGGHAWVKYDGATDYALYLAPIHNISQTQMTLGFQNVSNPKTGERFLIGLSERTPSAAPTQSPKNPSTVANYLSIAWICAYATGGTAILGILYLLSRHNLKQACAALGRSRYSIFSTEPALLNAVRSCNDGEDLEARVTHMV